MQIEQLGHNSFRDKLLALDLITARSRMPKKEMYLRAKLIEYDGRVKSLWEWMKETNLNYKTLESRLKKDDWTTKEAFEKDLQR